MGDEKKGRRRPWTWWLGVGLVLAGVGMLGWFAWQFWGTNWVAKRTHERLIEEVEKEWREQPGAKGAVSFPEGDVEAIIRIPRFGDDYAVPVLRGTSEAVLTKGYGHFDGSAEPGKKGNYALAAHRVTNGEPLRGMPSLKVGDEVVVETRDKIFTYELTTGGKDLEVTFEDTWVIDKLPTNPKAGGVQPRQEPGQRLITLTTCAELFHTDNRLIAFGQLVATEKR
ncbi:class E sortase [Nocardioides alcanivorans]|uniref:class E sortase n=1 Tax=Nocardioides alcanivorans TaxID=2897352 RepID=UPI001F2D96AF|nr:class E sortase [Nocardioides alcanivorans]